MELRCAQDEPVEQRQRGHNLYALGDEPVLRAAKTERLRIRLYGLNGWFFGG